MRKNYVISHASHGGDTQVGSDVLIKALPAGKSEKAILNAELAAGQIASGRFLLAVVDVDDDNAESDEDDNVTVSGPLP